MKNNKEEINLPLISIITVTYNAISVLEGTVLSVINQNYPNIEYIIIDGGSTDGTIDIIRKYEDRISYWISEPDNGIYDAMNKGIDKATGDWINFMNAGDFFISINALSDIFLNYSWDRNHFLYGPSIYYDNKGNKFPYPVPPIAPPIWKRCLFRHGALFAPKIYMKKYKFEIDPNIKIAADYNFILKCYIDGLVFENTNVEVLLYQKEGLSGDNIFRCWKENQYVLRKNKLYSINIRLYYLYIGVRILLRNNKVTKFILDKWKKKY